MDGVRQLYARPQSSATEQQQLQTEMRLLGIETTATIADSPVAFWQEHKAALDWWWQVQDLLRYNGAVCMGLDVPAVKADAEMSGREINQEDYQKLRLIAHTVIAVFNDRSLN